MTTKPASVHLAAVAALVVVLISGCTGASPAAVSPASTPPVLADAARAWCSQYTNEVRLGQAAMTLGIQDEAGSISMQGGGGGNLHDMIGRWAAGTDMQMGMSSSPATLQMAYEANMMTWQAESPGSFGRACMAAFAGH
jgi:hypothetical protein